MRMSLVPLLLLSLLCSCGRSVPKADRSSRSRADTGVARKDAGLTFDAGCATRARFVTDRAEWLDQLGGAPEREDFEGEPVGDISLPYVTEGNLRMEGSPPVAARIVTSSFTTKIVHATDFGSSLTIEPPFAVLAFSFDYFPFEDGWWLVLDSDNQILLAPGGEQAFAGVVVECGQYSAFRLRGPSGAQGGITFDNVEWY